MAKINYVEKYGRKVQKFQEGGAMGAAAAPAAAPAGGDPAADIMAAIEQVYQTQDPQLALQVVNAIYEMQQGGAEAAASGAAPAEGEGTPMARKGIKTGPVFKATIRK